MTVKKLIVSKVGVKTPGYTRIYIGRGSLFGNPFPISASTDLAHDRVHRRWQRGRTAGFAIGRGWQK